MAIYAAAGADPDDPPAIGALIEALTRREPLLARMRAEGRCIGDQVMVRGGVLPARARWLAAHELAEWWYARMGYDGADIEERCDACGAALVVPRASGPAAAPAPGSACRREAAALLGASLLLLDVEQLAGGRVLPGFVWVIARDAGGEAL
mgnify:FL=1